MKLMINNFVNLFFNLINLYDNYDYYNFQYFEFVIGLILSQKGDNENVSYYQNLLYYQYYYNLNSFYDC